MSMNEFEFSLKELEDLRLKATQNIEISGVPFQAGETIVLFDKIQLANFREIKKQWTAHGGFEDMTRVTWETTKEVDLSFSQGIFSKTQYALLSNSGLVTVNQDPGIDIYYREELETNENSEVGLKYVPLSGTLFIYNKATGEKLTDYIIDNNIITFSRMPYTDIIIDYRFWYQDKSVVMTIGQSLISGYLSLEAKSRVKDDITGAVKTVIIGIPRLKLVSDLSLRLGKNANPVVANFNAVGYPVGSRGQKTIMEMYFLDSDIDAEI